MEEQEASPTETFPPRNACSCHQLPRCRERGTEGDHRLRFFRAQRVSQVVGGGRRLRAFKGRFSYCLSFLLPPPPTRLRPPTRHHSRFLGEANPLGILIISLASLLCLPPDLEDLCSPALRNSLAPTSLYSSGLTSLCVAYGAKPPFDDDDVVFFFFRSPPVREDAASLLRGTFFPPPPRQIQHTALSRLPQM